VSLLAASTRRGSLLGGGDWEVQQLAERCRSGPMQGRAQRRLHGFQVEALASAPLAEDHPQPAIYFLRDFPAERFRRFFSWLDKVGSSTGRKRQIASLTSRSRRPSSRKR